METTQSTTAQENLLGEAASAYLRSARYQPVKWQEWGAAAFQQAQRDGKPVLLDIGAVWCHWCHVMDRESYDDPQTAALINELFVPVKVDRDERPDVDTRYQAAVSAISGQGGWPLTAFLTAEGKPFFGGTYFPPEERMGRPSFGRVLRTMAEAYRNRRDEVEESAGSILEAIDHNEGFAAHAASPGVALLDKLTGSALVQFDERNGGFGTQPKFPHSGALDLLLDLAGRPVADASRAGAVVRVTLDKMAAGGIYDQLAGGFHRYSVDERWVVPHFEKMAYDNSELLKNYVRAFQSFADPRHARVAADIVRWMDAWLSDRGLGGFYASQDADASLDDDGDYFTWTLEEARAALLPDELEVAAAFYTLRPVGDMHHNPAKNVLHLGANVEEIAQRSGREVSEVGALLARAKTKLYAARLKRRTPFVDKTIYTGWNAMCVSAYLLAGQTLNLAEVTAFALLSLDRVLDIAWSATEGLARVVAYGETGDGGKRLPAGLDEYALLGTAALDAWEATGEARYFAAARELADAMLERFHDAEDGGFFDIERAEGEVLGVLGTGRKPIQDAPTPAGNAVAASLLLRLASLTGSTLYEEHARDTLEAFAGVAEHYGLYAGNYALALRRAVEAPLQICIVGEGELADAMAATAMAGFAANKSVIRLRWEQLGTLPSVLADTLPHLPQQRGAVALVCKGSTCSPPSTSLGDLEAQLAQSLNRDNDAASWGLS